MNAVVAAFLLGAVVGVLVFLMVSEWVPRCVQYWRDANRRVNSDIALLQAIPPGVEEKDQ